MAYLTFGLTCWGQACNTYLNKILVLQKKALRFMYFVDRKTHAIPLFRDAKILPVVFCIIDQQPFYCMIFIQI